MDALSELLRVVKLQGAIFFKAECAAPWKVQSPPSNKLRPYIPGTASRVIEFHLIAEGRCSIRVGEETTPLAAGDFVMMPHGDAHLMSNGTGGEILDGEAGLPALLRREVLVSQFGGNGEPTRMICGYLACEAGLIEPLLAGLPRVLRVNMRTDPFGQGLESMVHHAVAQAVTASTGSAVIVARLAEALFVEVLRRYLAQLPAGRSGWLAAAADPIVGRALAALHQKPEHPWTLDDLANQANASRSVLTERFARYFEQGPIAYLADWRLELAAESLRNTSRSVLQIASEIGYDSEAAFNRAFKRRFTTPPGQYRKVWRAGQHSVETALTSASKVAYQRGGITAP